MSIDISGNKRRRSDRTLICRGFCGACEGQALALRVSGRVFFVVRGAVLRDCPLILNILFILAILLQTIAIKVLTDLFSLLLRCSIDIKVFQTFFSLILTNPANPGHPASDEQAVWRGTGPRPTGGTPAPVEQARLSLPVCAQASTNYR